MRLYERPWRPTAYQRGFWSAPMFALRGKDVKIYLPSEKDAEEYLRGLMDGLKKLPWLPK